MAVSMLCAACRPQVPQQEYGSVTGQQSITAMAGIQYSGIHALSLPSIVLLTVQLPATGLFLTSLQCLAAERAVDGQRTA